MIRSCLYSGSVMHARLRPKQHRFSYRFTSWFIDLDELQQLDRTLFGFGYNRAGLFSFHERDFGPGQSDGLKLFIKEVVEAQGMGSVDRVCLLCQPRCLGYIFNSLSTYFCYDADGQLVATIYEVSNTRHERHLYLIAADERRPLRQQADKQMYVSPFIPMNCRYHFQVQPPENAFSVVIRQSDNEGELFHALWRGDRRPLNANALLAALMRPPMTMKTFAAIHWQALKLWIKGIPVVDFTPTKKFQISLGQWKEGI